MIPFVGGWLLYKGTLNQDILLIIMMPFFGGLVTLQGILEPRKGPKKGGVTGLPSLIDLPSQLGQTKEEAHRILGSPANPKP